MNNNIFKMEENPYDTLFINIDVNIAIGSNRNYAVNIENNLFENIERSSAPMFTFSGIGSDEYTLTNNTFRNVSFQIGLAEFKNIGYVTFENMYYQDSINIGQYVFSFIDPIKLALYDITMANVSSFDDNNWTVANLDMGDILIERLVMTDCNINTNPAFLLSGMTNKMRVADSSFNNMKVHKNSAIFEIGLLATFEFENCNFTKIEGYNTESVNNYAINIKSIGLESTEISYFKNSYFSQCNVGCFQIGSETNSNAPSKFFEIENIHFRDCYFENEANIVRIGEITSYEDYNMSMKSLTFTNLTFKNRGSLIKLQQLLPSQMIVEDMVMTNIVGGSISVEPYDVSDQALKTRVLFRNLRADSINADFNSLIRVTEQGEVEIIDSVFTNIFCFEEGAVIYGGASEAYILMTNAHFENITSLKGGAIYVESRSFVVCDNCTFYKNFAIEGGVIATEENGYFELKNCVITRNLAISGAISNIYNSGQTSIINNCEVYDNRAIGKEELMREMNVE